MTDIGGDAVDVVYAGPPDDAERVADRLERQRDGFAVAPATSSEAVLSAVEGGVECVVTADRVADAGAIELLRAVRERDADLPVVLVPATGDESLAADAVAAGATDYLPREDGSVPFERLADRVESAVGTYCEVRQQRHEREFLEQLQDTTTDSTVVVDRDGRVVWANETARRRLDIGEEGYTVGDSPVYDEDGEFIPPDERPYFEVLTTGEPLENFRCQIEFDDERRWLSVNAEPIELDGERYVAISSEDVTERVRYRQRLEDTRQELATELSEVFERVSDAFFALDEEWRFTYVNETAEDLLEVDADEVVGESVWDEFEAAVGTTFHDRYHEAMESQRAVTFEEYYQPLSTWFEVRAYPSGTGLSVYFRDVTDRKEREQELERLEKRFRTVFEQSRDAIFINDPYADELVDVNPAGCEMLGYDRGEILSMGPSDLHADEMERFREFVDGVFEEGSGFTDELTCLHSDGHRISVEMSASRIELDDRDLMLAVVRDVSERRERERKLAESRNRLRTLVDHFPNGAVALVDEELRYQVMGGEAFDSMNVTIEDAESEPVEVVLPADVAEVVVPRYEAALDGESSKFTVEYGGEVREIRAVPVRDDDGEVQAALAISQDVTERHEHERRLRALHDASRDLFRAESADGVNRAVVRAVWQGLDLSGAAVYEHDAATDELVPAAGSGVGLLDDEALPALPVDDGSLVGHAFVDGETKVYDDVRESGHLHADPGETPVRSALLVPFDDEYVLVVGSEAAGTYGERTRQLVEVVTANAAVAHERVARERELETRASQQAAVTDLGRRALANRPLDELFEEAAELVADGLDVDFSKVLDYRPGEGELLLREGVGWDEGYVGEATVPAGDDDSQAAHLLSSEEPVVVEDMAVEDRFRPSALLTDHDVASGVSVVVGSVDDPWGVLGAHHGDERTFSEDDVNFVQGVANVLASTVENRLRRREMRETAEVFRELYDVAADDALTFDQQLDRLLDLGRAYLGLDVGLMTRVEDGEQTFAAVRGGGGDLQSGASCPLEEAYCRATLDAGELLAVEDAAADDRIGGAAHERWGLDAYIGAPVTVRGEQYGTLCFVAEDGREEPFDDTMETFVELAAQWVSFELGRQQRQWELERTERQFEAAFDNPHSFMAILDPDGTVRKVNDVALEFAGLDHDEVAGEPFPETPWWDHSPALQHSLREWIDRAADGEYVRFEEDHVVDDDRATVDGVLHPVTEDDGEVVAIFATGRDVSERKEQERRLRRRIEQQEVVTDLGRRALESSDVDALMADAAERVTETLDTDYCEVLDLDADAGELLLREGVGWDEGYVGEATVPAGDDDSQAAHLLSSEEPVVVEDMAVEDRFRPSALLTDHDVASGVSVVVGPADDPWGVLGTHDTDREEFSAQDVNFLQSVATILANAVARREDEMELRRQRERLAALNDLNSLAQRIGEAVVQQSSREEIERLACEALSASDAYEFAWVGEVDETRGEVVDRAQAGDPEYLDELTIRVDEAPDRRGPTATAARTGEMQVVDDVRTAETYEPWRELATDHGYRSSAAVPIGYDDARYGVLNVYSGRSNAFGEEERETFRRLGTIVAHAIRSVERERELRESERRYRTMAENVPNGSVTLVDEDLRYQLVAGRTYGEIDLDPAEMEGKRIPDVETMPEDVRAEVSDIMRRALDGEEVSTEVQYRDRTYAYHAIPLSADGDVHAAMTLSQDITERVRREAELEHERERLELLNRLIRHNLLNSLNVVDARLSLVEGHVDYEVSDHLETAADRTAEMIDLIRTIRALMRAISDDEERDLEPMSVGELLREEVDDAGQALPDAVFETGSLPEVEVLADELLAEVFENLLVNAVQHNDKDQPRVWVDVATDDDRVVVEVADNGPGVPEELRESIFDKGTKDFESPGTGFGLHLVREIVDGYDGDVSVSNVDASDLPASFESGGACFRVALPRA